MKILLLLQLFFPLILADLGGNYDHNSKDQYVEIAEAEMDFALKIYQKMARLSERPPPNLFISPVSIYTTLSMLALGARSTTRQEILKGMGLDYTKTDQELHEGHKKLLQVISQQNKDEKFNLGNEIFIDKSGNILQEYRHDVTHYYNASIHSISFSDPQKAENTINKLVSDKTDSRIQNVVSDLNSHTKMVLVDYAVFEAKWKSEFERKNTKMRNFNRGGTPAFVPTMHRHGKYKTYKDKELNVNVLDLPYTKNVALLIIVPQLGDLISVEQQLTAQKIRKYLHSVKTSVVDLYIPKISFSTPIHVDRALQSMNMGVIFHKDNADFSKISRNKKLSVSSFYHQSYISLEERGTEESAATSAALGLASSSPEFIIDHPFLMVVYHQLTKAILGIGRYMDPLWLERRN